MALLDRLRATALRDARLIDAIDADFAAELSRVLAGVSRRVAALVAQLEQDGGRLVSTRAALGRGLALRTQLQTALEAAGYPQLVVSAVSEPLDRLAVQVLRGTGVAAQAAASTPIDLDTIEALRAIRTRDLLELGDDVVNTLWRGVLDGVIGAREPQALTRELAELMQVSERQARTLYDTAVSTYSRQVRQLRIEAPSGEDRFLYMGALDAKTRPFCRALVGEIRTRDELDGLDNGQLPNTLLTGGGYNCRHVWQFVGDATLEELKA